jgi:hypothetical protein
MRSSTGDREGKDWKVVCTERFVDAPSVVVLSIAVDETRRNEARSGERLRVSRDYGDFEGRWQPLEG